MRKFLRLKNNNDSLTANTTLAGINQNHYEKNNFTNFIPSIFKL